MPKQIIIASAIEAVLILLTTVLLIRQKRMSSVTAFAGLLFLCSTFCWSVILGCVFAIHDMLGTFRI